jgi:hypothetical protein
VSKRRHHCSQAGTFFHILSNYAFLITQVTALERLIPNILPEEDLPVTGLLCSVSGGDHHVARVMWSQDLLSRLRSKVHTSVYTSREFRYEIQAPCEAIRTQGGKLVGRGGSGM